MEKKSEFALEKINYMIIGVGVALIVIGFVLMSGGRVGRP